MQIDQLYRIYEQHPSVQTDTRKLQPGDIFFALKGPNYNGNEYAPQALEQGAAYCIVQEAPAVADDRIIVVEDTLLTLQALAKYHRQQFDIPFIAITGSNGKTTTKELIHAVLSSTYTTYTTEGNLNNHIGVPLTLLKIKKDAQMAVIEMGANHQKEIESYCQYTLPTHGLITNCGKAHLEGFGGVEGVKKGKGELYDYLRSAKGTAFVYWEYDYLQTMSAGIPTIIRYGGDPLEVTVAGKVLDDPQFLSVQILTGPAIDRIDTRLVGNYNLPNVLAAVCIGHTFSVPAEKIKQALEAYTPSNSRSQLMVKGGNRIVLDAYNANPSSMKVAIENFAHMPGAHKILFLGAMMELGPDSAMEHEKLVQLIHQYSWQQVVLVGDGFEQMPGAHLHFKEVAAARAWFDQQQVTGATILIKGSRSMQMEKLLD